MVDLEIGLVKAFGWSLIDIDRTDIGSLIPFILRMNEGAKSQGKPKVKRVFIDEVNL